jgi:TPR repeat protein
MHEKSPAEAYLDACKLYWEIQSCYDDPAHLANSQAQLVVLQSCFQRLLRASDSQDSELWYALGCAFGSRLGTERDPEEAIRWLRKAAEAGHTGAMVSLGSRLQLPEPSLDAVGAIHWFRTAAEKADPRGMTSLGFAYREGRGVPCDHAEAVRWFVRAAEAGDDEG